MATDEAALAAALGLR